MEIKVEVTIEMRDVDRDADEIFGIDSSHLFGMTENVISTVGRNLTRYVEVIMAQYEKEMTNGAA